MGVLGACEPPTLPAPTITGVEPARVWNGADIPVVIEGTNFLPRIDVDAQGYGTDLDGDWEVTLLGADGSRVPLSGVSRQDPEHLLAVVGAGVQPGDYQIEVFGPSRQAVVSEPLLEVSVNQEVGLRVDYFDDPKTYSADESVRLLFEAVGFDSERVFTDVPVLVTLDGARVEIIHTASFEQHQELPLDEGVGFVAVLPDGQAVLPIDLRAPGRLDVVARSAPGAPELQQGTLTLFIDGGSDLPAELRLPDGELGTGTTPDPFVATAGEPFELGITVRDADNSTILTEPLELTLTNTCGTLLRDVTVQGVTFVELTVERATDPDSLCVDDQILVAAGAVGASETFQVVGGEPAFFELDFLDAEVRAGEGTQLLVRPTDAFGNTTSYTGPIEITDDLGSLTEVSCGAGEKFLLCTVVGTVAGDDITVTASTPDGLTGSVDGFTVRPAQTTGELFLSSPGKSAVAGERQELHVTFADVYGNPQETDDIDPSQLVLADEIDDATCVFESLMGSDGVYGCTFTVARPRAVITASGFGVDRESPAFRVDNGPLAEVSLSAPASVVAGDAFTLVVSATDAFGNPYTVQADPLVELSDDLDGLQATSVTLDVDGEAALSTSLVRAGSTVVRASQGGVELGSSATVLVSAGPTDGLSLSLGLPWAYVGEPAPLTVESVDAYGNRTALSGSATVTSSSGAGAPQVVTLVNGLATTDYTFVSAAVDETLSASVTAGPTGSTVPLYVVERCVSGGPVAALDFGGFSEALACLDPVSEQATLSASLGGSTPGASALVGYALAPEGGEAVTDVQPDLLLTLDEVGATRLQGLAVAADGCGDEVEGVAWVGLDDGSATGPIEMTVSVPSVDPFDLATVDVQGVLDCARDPADSATVNLRTTAGELSGVTPTGEGLQLVLDAVGDGSVDLETLGGLASSTLQVHAWVPSGAAGGLLEVPVVGDEINPTVIAQSPAGLELGTVSEVVLTFSEPLLPTTVLSSRFSVSGPAGVAVDTVSLSPEGDEVTVALSPSADGSAGAYTLTVSRELRDLAGRRLAGTWGGFADDYVGSFGDVGGSVDPVTCALLDPASGRFRPDGDDGAAEESDTVVLSLESGFTPAWWVVEVRDASGALVRQVWDVPLGPVDTWAWDGRNQLGQVVANGTYSVTVAPDDGVGNRGTACTVQAIVDNREGTVP
jgi:hypothetical protein